MPLRSFYKTMSTLLGGSYINNFNRFGKLYQTYIQAAPEYRRDKYSLESYFVDDGQGNSIPVSSFTTVRDTTGYPIRKRRLRVAAAPFTCWLLSSCS